jgi:hypothetical protein
MSGNGVTFSMVAAQIIQMLLRGLRDPNGGRSGGRAKETVRLLLTQIRRRRLHFVAGFASIDDAGTGRRAVPHLGATKLGTLSRSGTLPVNMSATNA